MRALALLIVFLASVSYGSDVAQLDMNTVVNEMSIVVKTDPAADAGTVANPDVKICGTTSDCTDTCQAACGPWKQLSANGVKPASSITVKLDGGDVAVVSKVCFQMPAGGTDAWTWSEATVKAGDGKEIKFAPTAAAKNANLIATSIRSAEVCKENPPKASEEDLLGQVKNNIKVKVATEACDICGTDSVGVELKVCGSKAGCTSACSEVCSESQAVSKTAILKGATTEVTVDAGVVQNIMKVCFKMKASNTDGWTWTTADVVAGADKFQVKAGLHNKMVVGDGTKDSAWKCAAKPPPPPGPDRSR